MNPLTVLVVDDDSDICAFVTAALEGEGYRVICATGIAVLRVAEEVHPNIILLEVRMPQLDGVQISRLLRAHPRVAKIPIVIMSGMGQKNAPFSLSYDAWLSKPFDLIALLSIVAAMDNHPSHIGRPRCVVR